MPIQAYAHPRRTTPRRSTQTRNHLAFAYPAPQKGINTAQPLPGGDPMTAIRLENLIPRALGVQLRRGYLRWQSNLDGEVRSFLKYQAPNGTEELFAATSEGKIYDVTLPLPSVTVPVPVATVINGAPPGEWTSLNFVTGAGVHVLVAVNPGGGYWIYDGANFIQITLGAGANQVSNIDPDTFVFVTVFRNRLWFLTENSASAWYLPLGVYFGAAIEFPFGPMLPNGGALAALVNWTYDGSGGDGAGTSGGGTMNSQLVVISEQGDVLVYGHADAVNPTLFQGVEGRWYVGRVPVGRRFFSTYMADVIILSERGMCFMSELMRGQGFFTNVGNAQAINSSLAGEISRSLDTRYWEVVFLPSQQMVVINRAEINVENLQWVYEVNNRAFAMLRGIPMLTLAQLGSRVYTGDLDGRVWQAFEGNSDGHVDDIPGLDLEGIVVTAFQALGDPVRVKRFLMARLSGDWGPQTRINVMIGWDPSAALRPGG